MAVRRLAEQQPETFALTPENRGWAAAKMRDYPEGRQASAVIPILWKAQEQHGGWLPEPAIRLVADMLGMPYIRVFEVATFYTMFQLKPVGSLAHIGVCGTTPCMLRGAEALVAVCRSRIAPRPFELSADGRFSWEEVECAGACVNAPMVQIGADTFEDLTAESFGALLDALDRGAPPAPGPQSSRRASEPITGPTTLTSPRKDVHPTMPAAPPDDTPNPNVDPRSPAAAQQNAAKPETRERADTEATRTTNDPPKDPSPVAPEPKTDGRIADGPDAPEKQQSAKASPGAPTGEPAPPTSEQARRAERIVTEGPAKVGPGDAVLTEEKTVDAATKAAADRAAPSAERAQTPLVEAAAPPSTPDEAGPQQPASPAAPAAAGADEPGGAPAATAPAPEPRASAAARADAAGTRPKAEARGENGEADELQNISGIGPRIARTLNDLGIWRYEQIAAWDRADREWVSAYLAFKGRIDREKWVEQAQRLIDERGAWGGDEC